MAQVTAVWTQEWLVILSNHWFWLASLSHSHWRKQVSSCVRSTSKFPEVIRVMVGNGSWMMCVHIYIYSYIYTYYCTIVYIYICMYIRDTAHINIHDISFGSIDSPELALYSPRSLDWCSPILSPRGESKSLSTLFVSSQSLFRLDQVWSSSFWLDKSREIHIW